MIYNNFGKLALKKKNNKTITILNFARFLDYFNLLSMKSLKNNRYRSINLIFSI